MIWIADRPEADPREASRIRPWMTDEERAWLYDALEETTDYVARCRETRKKLADERKSKVKDV